MIKKLDYHFCFPVQYFYTRGHDSRSFWPNVSLLDDVVWQRHVKTSSVINVENIIRL